MTPRYRLEHVVRRYRTSRSRRSFEALRVPRLEVAPGEILAVVGANGSGKSTLLETMAFLQRPDEGHVALDDRDVWAKGESLAARRRCPMLLQRTVLFKTTVLKNVMYGLRARGMSRAEARREAEQVLRLVGLDSLKHRTRGELSGGERQRVALARLLVLKPETLLLDEPTAHVDRSNAQLIEEIIRDLHATRGMTVILASHDLRQAQSLADRVITLIDGRLFHGTMDNLFAGTFSAKEDGFWFQSEKGLTLHMANEAIVREVANDPVEPTTGSTQIAIDAERLEVLTEDAPNAQSLGGSIESIHRHRDHCQLTVRLDTGEAICASLPFADYERAGLNLGQDVHLRLASGAVRICGGRRAV